MSFHPLNGFYAGLGIEVVSSSTIKAFLLSLLILSSFSFKPVWWPPVVLLCSFQPSYKNNQQDKRKHTIWNFVLSFKSIPGRSQKEMPFPVGTHIYYLLSKALPLMWGRVWDVAVYVCYHSESLHCHKS